MLTLALLRDVARQVIGDRDIVLAETMTAVDVAGWDSLNHTLIVMEVAQRLDVSLDAYELGQCPTIGALIAAVNRQARI